MRNYENMEADFFNETPCMKAYFSPLRCAALCVHAEPGQQYCGLSLALLAWRVRFRRLKYIGVKSVREIRGKGTARNLAGASLKTLRARELPNGPQTPRANVISVRCEIEAAVLMHH